MKYLIAVVVGAIIGYVTNWLAIKMLFRPLKEKKLFGFKIPFTPGLIPKERFRISKSVGQTIGEHLLTKETVVESLCTEEMTSQLRSWTKNKIHELVNDETTLGDKLKSFVPDDEKIKKDIEDRLYNSLLEKVRSADFKEKFSNVLKVKIAEEISKDENKLIFHTLSSSVVSKVTSYLNSYKNSYQFEAKVQRFISNKLIEASKLDKTFDEVLPESILLSLKQYLLSKNSEISAYIKESLGEEAAKEKIKSIVGDMMGSLSPMIAMFINPESISDKISNTLQDYMDKEDTKEQISVVISNLLEKVLKSKVCDLIQGLSAEAKASIEKVSAEIVLKKVITDKFTEGTIKELHDKLELGENIKKLLFENNTVTAIFDNFIYAKVTSFIVNREVIHYGVERILKVSIKSLFNGEEDTITEIAVKSMERLYKKFIETKAPEVIETLNIPEIVEKKINLFDTEFIEKLILDISSKELSAITWLGALLGGIMGLLSPALNALTNFLAG